MTALTSLLASNLLIRYYLAALPDPMEASKEVKSQRYGVQAEVASQVYCMFTWIVQAVRRVETDFVDWQQITDSYEFCARW